MEKKEMNIFEKLTKAKKMILESNLKKSGENRFAGFKYYELADITPKIIEVCEQLKLHTRITFDNEYATLTITNVEKAEEQARLNRKNFGEKRNTRKVRGV